MLSGPHLRRRRPEALWPVAIGFVALAGAAHLTLTHGAARGIRTVVFAPWVSRAEAIDRATRQARLVGVGALQSIVQVEPGRDPYEAEGAWLVLPGAFLSGCGGKVGPT